MSFIRSNVHTHTLFCDGLDTMEDMIISAVKNNYDTLGFSFHSYVCFDTDNCIKSYPSYIEEYKRLKVLYENEINLLNGVELDLFGEKPYNYDFIIGSVHYFNEGGKFYSVDYSRKDFKKTVDSVFNGNVYKAIEAYYLEVEYMINNLKPDIIGHFDLITRFNKNNDFFDENSYEYKKILEKTLLNIPDYKTAEINLGRFIKGEGDIYPSQNLLSMLNEKHFKFMLSLDAHRKEVFSFDFKEIIKRLKQSNIKSLCCYKGNNLVDFEI